VPTLRQLLQLAHGKARVLIEIKSASPYRVMDAIAAERMERGVIVISFSPEYLRPVARQRPEVERALLLWKFENDVPNLAMFIRLGRELQATTLAPCIELCTPELVAAIHAAGLRVFVWTANTPEQQRAMRNAGVDGIISDFPERLKSNL
jgi:glycerophosphoryl diester phosphodiesterase